MRPQPGPQFSLSRTVTWTRARARPLPQQPRARLPASQQARSSAPSGHTRSSALQPARAHPSVHSDSARVCARAADCWAPLVGAPLPQTASPPQPLRSRARTPAPLPRSAREARGPAPFFPLPRAARFPPPRPTPAPRPKLPARPSAPRSQPGPASRSPRRFSPRERRPRSLTAWARTRPRPRRCFR